MEVVAYMAVKLHYVQNKVSEYEDAHIALLHRRGDQGNFSYIYPWCLSAEHLMHLQDF